MLNDFIHQFPYSDFHEMNLDWILKKMKELAEMFLPIEIGLMILSGGALFLLAPPLMGLFSRSAEVIANNVYFADSKKK